MKCTTHEQLHLEMARVYKMCEGTKFEGHEEECVKYYKSVMSFIPAFTDKSDCYEFALGIVEDKLVWEGDTLYGRTSGDQFTVGKSFAFTKQQGAIQELSWNPPAPPKPKTVSISVNGGEPIVLVLPDNDSEEFFYIDGFRNLGKWKSSIDRDDWVLLIRNLLEGKL